jgi:hypothetical protein
MAWRDGHSGSYFPPNNEGPIAAVSGGRSQVDLDVFESIVETLIFPGYAGRPVR